MSASVQQPWVLLPGLLPCVFLVACLLFPGLQTDASGHAPFPGTTEFTHLPRRSTPAALTYIRAKRDRTVRMAREGKRTRVTLENSEYLKAEHIFRTGESGNTFFIIEKELIKYMYMGGG